jgi:hypothetical protein
MEADKMTTVPRYSRVTVPLDGSRLAEAILPFLIVKTDPSNARSQTR